MYLDSKNLIQLIIKLNLADLDTSFSLQCSDIHVGIADNIAERKKQALLRKDAQKSTLIKHGYQQAMDALQLLMGWNRDPSKGTIQMMIENRSRHPLLPSAPSIDHRKVSSRSLENADK